MIAILYSCKVCGLAEQQVDLAFRESSEDVVKWLRTRVMPAVAVDHGTRSPGCPAENVDLRIPAPAGAQWLGGPVVQ